MPDKSIFLRCDKCGVINRMPLDKLHSNPKCGKCKNYIQLEKMPLDVITDNFDREVLAWPGTVLLEFWTPWCGYCRIMAPLVEKLSREKAGILKVAKVNLDNEPYLGARFGINATPTFYVYRNGIKLGEIAGAVPKEQFEAWIDSFLQA